MEIVQKHPIQHQTTHVVVISNLTIMGLKHIRDIIAGTTLTRKSSRFVCFLSVFPCYDNTEDIIIIVSHFLYHFWKHHTLHLYGSA